MKFLSCCMVDILLSYLPLVTMKSPFSSVLIYDALVDNVPDSAICEQKSIHQVVRHC
jgi:hypothetical protein